MNLLSGFSKVLRRGRSYVKRGREYLASERITVGAPYSSTREWFEANKNQEGTDFRLWREAETIGLRVDFPDFGFNDRLMTVTSEEYPAAFVATIPNARLWYTYWNPNAIIAPDNRPLADLTFRVYSMDRLNESLEKRGWRIPRHRLVPGTVVDLTCLGDGQNYSHWLLDCLPKFHVLEQTGLMRPDHKYLVNAKTKFVLDSFDVIGIPGSQILSLEETGPHVRFEKLLATSPLTSHFRPPWVFECLQRRFTLADSKPRQLLYVGRKDAAIRRVANEDELLAVLQPLGFTPVTLSGLTILQQAKLFSEAAGIVGAHGAGLTNLTFCQPHTPVLELFPDGYWSKAFWSISSTNNLRYGCLAFPGMSANAKETDYRVDPSRVVEAIKVLGFPI